MEEEEKRGNRIEERGRMWRKRDGEKVEEERWGQWYRRKREGMNEEERW